ncbi:hypothetical protein M422DRAFT_169254, partial [Sphaerobolus stellatus SS14]
GSAQCCNPLGSANSLPRGRRRFGFLEDLSVVVGLRCTPITVAGLGQGANCAQQPVCCTDNEFNGIVSRHF